MNFELPRRGLYVIAIRYSDYIDWQKFSSVANARMARVRTFDRRTIDDPAKVKHYGGTSDWWYSHGENHRVVDGHIVRDLTTERWVVEVADLESLVREAGCLRVRALPEGYLELDICDDC